MNEPQFLHTSNKGVNVKPINAALHRSKNEGCVVPTDILFLYQILCIFFIDIAQPVAEGEMAEARYKRVCVLASL